ncbi:MAG TPA: hypothetical protein VIL72_08045, partial [Beijerinckiaceae bacterium]
DPRRLSRGSALMAGALWVDGPAAPWSFLFVVVVLGGLGAVATGRAVATGWRPFRYVALAMAPLAAAVGFLQYVLFGEAAIPLFALGAALAGLPEQPAAALATAATELRFYGVIYAVLLAIAGLAYRAARVRVMTRQYAFAYEAAGPLGWRARARG